MPCRMRFSSTKKQVVGLKLFSTVPRAQIVVRKGVKNFVENSAFDVSAGLLWRHKAVKLA